MIKNKINIGKDMLRKKKVKKNKKELNFSKNEI